MKFGAMDGTKPYKFIEFGAMDGTKPYKFIGVEPDGDKLCFLRLGPDIVDLQPDAVRMSMCPLGAYMCHMGSSGLVRDLRSKAEPGPMGHIRGPPGP